ncbi:MAG: OmpA family protein [Desulfobacula sp.]|nr:OmpA family protein [Desulfobacula sp.]MBT3484929.1 OmpA family protein [Desulfobacula sp.]MBT3803235.1 OmpA family protein [Desulfobacula sp.]MBT4024618.1 OmpA family protein [Desulfobacula sp.]MBT4197558.1 OmpA family protein [Desulfobacula sp.]
MIQYLHIFFILIFLCACGPKTIVILLPDDDGKTGSVVVKSQGSSTTLDAPYTYTEVSDDKSDFPIKPIDKKKVTDEYQLLLNAEPAKPAHFILYFEENSINLTKESLTLIPEILQVSKKRSPSEISVIGHSDTMGSSEHNNILSLQRAENVGEILKKHDTSLKKLNIKSHGENDLLIITGDNVPEKKNRRVEIMIR